MLLTSLFHDILTNNGIKNKDPIKLAPERELLNKFGGPLSIEEFRSYCSNCVLVYGLHLPPMIPTEACLTSQYVFNL